MQLYNCGALGWTDSDTGRETLARTSVRIPGCLSTSLGVGAYKWLRTQWAHSSPLHILLQPSLLWQLHKQSINDDLTAKQPYLVLIFVLYEPRKMTKFTDRIISLSSFPSPFSWHSSFSAASSSRPALREMHLVVSPFLLLPWIYREQEKEKGTAWWKVFSCPDGCLSRTSCTKSAMCCPKDIYFPTTPCIKQQKADTEGNCWEKRRGHLSLCDDALDDKRPKGVSPWVRAGPPPVERVRMDVGGHAFKSMASSSWPRNNSWGPAWSRGELSGCRALSCCPAPQLAIATRPPFPESAQAALKTHSFILTHKFTYSCILNRSTNGHNWIHYRGY